ncbi:virulence protein RhuM/Fic/DOC family protein [Hyphomicrobium sp. B1]|uniref:RhuM family protein n=1 Tax=Hyphomicrobium sp. B1 TaxID=3075651 RepID=UPI003C2AEF6E
MMKKSAPSSRQVELYVAPSGEASLNVVVEGETVWLTQRQMAELFKTSADNIGLHLKNIYAEEELVEKATTEDYSVVQTEGRRRVTRTLRHYNLDAILSVGYRVNSKRGTQFRIWATSRLKDYLLKGYALNQRRLEQKGVEIEQAVKLLGQTLQANKLVTDEGQALLDLVSEYARTWRLLLDYDENKLPDEPKRPTKRLVRLTVVQARDVIAKLKASLVSKKEASALFGAERESGLEAILGNLEQTFGGQPLYPSVEARAAHLLYFVIKDHPFSDGNKRIASFLFLHYLDKAGRLVRANGQRRFDDNALVALALLIAESAPGQKDLMIRLTMGLLEDVG